MNRCNSFLIKKMKLLFLDCETAGLPINRYMAFTNTNIWPTILQISWQYIDYNTNTMSVLKNSEYFVKLRGKWNADAERIHRIPESIIQKFGKEPSEVFDDFAKDLTNCDIVIAHNMYFDRNCIMSEFQRLYDKGLLDKKPLELWPQNKKIICTMMKTRSFCAIPFQNQTSKPGEFKFPKLAELYAKLFGKEYDISGAELHNSTHDVSCLINCFKQLLEIPEFSNILST